MFNCIIALCDRLFAVIGAIIFAQAPLFMQQYMQQVTGRGEELYQQVKAMKEAARFSGKSLDQLISKFLSSSDIDFVHQGELMQALVQRWQTLESALQSWQSSNFLEKPFVFLRHLDREVFSSTFKSFTMGLPLNLEGAVYAMIGTVAGFLLFFCLRKTLSWIARVIGGSYNSCRKTT